MVTRQDMIDQGYIRVREHPEDPSYKIYSYTEKAQYEKVWNEHTIECRGLIERGGEVIARPFPKFFNYGEHPEGSLDLDKTYTAYDKADGSLGIVYIAPDGLPAVATRGSFNSEQAIWATKWLREQHPEYRPMKHTTELFEIIYPDNRIVLDYGGFEGLIYLGSMDTRDNDYYEPHNKPPEGFKVVELIAKGTLKELLALPPRNNAEGVVLVCPWPDTLIKVKQDDYIALHKIVTNFTERNVWRMFYDNGEEEWQDYLAKLPDEFAQDAVDIVFTYSNAICKEEMDARHFWETIPTGLHRREFAEYAKKYKDPSLIFAIEDGKDLHTIIEKRIRP